MNVIAMITIYKRNAHGKRYKTYNDSSAKSPVLSYFPIVFEYDDTQEKIIINTPDQAPIFTSDIISIDMLNTDIDEVSNNE